MLVPPAPGGYCTKGHDAVRHFFLVIPATRRAGARPNIREANGPEGERQDGVSKAGIQFCLCKIAAANRLEALKCDRKGQHSIRIYDLALAQWRYEWC